MSIASRLPMLLNLRTEDHDVLRANASDPDKDKNGSCTSIWALEVRFQGVARFYLNGDIGAFKSDLAESARLRISLFERFERGEKISESYVTMLSYKALFDALAAGAMDLATQLAMLMGKRPELEAEYDHPFDLAIGHALRAMVLDESELASYWTEKLNETAGKHLKDLVPYSDVFRAILAKDEQACNNAIQLLVKGHKKQTKGGGVFSNTVDEVLAVWGVGAANLARWRGVDAAPVPPLIPTELLTD